MFSKELDSGYNKYPNLSSLDSLLYIGIKLSTRSIFKIYFERIFEVCFERILRVYFISTYQIQCIFERAKNQFTRGVFYFLIKTHFDVTIFPNEEYIKGKIPKMSCQVPNSTSTWDHNENIET